MNNELTRTQIVDEPNEHPNFDDAPEFEEFPDPEWDDDPIIPVSDLEDGFSALDATKTGQNKHLTFRFESECFAPERIHPLHSDEIAGGSVADVLYSNYSSTVYAAWDAQGNPCQLVEFTPWLRCRREDGGDRLLPEDDFAEALTRYILQLSHSGQINLADISSAPPSHDYGYHEPAPSGKSQCFFANGTFYHFRPMGLHPLMADIGGLALNDESTVRTCKQLLEYLLKLLQIHHEQGIIHGNIHPGSFIVDRKGQLHLEDFDLGLPRQYASRYSEMPEYWDMYNPSMVSKRHTPDYDLCCLALVFCQLLTHDVTPGWVANIPQLRCRPLENAELVKHFGREWVSALDYQLTPFFSEFPPSQSKWSGWGDAKRWLDAISGT